MNVRLLYFDDCPSWRLVDERLRLIATERPDVTLSYARVETQEEADRLGFHGSPSILVDGQDVFAGAGDPVGLTCRLFATPDGLAGAPTLEQLRRAVDDA
ncbi:thioredoxin family protein [Janibacter terrae]|uniref:Thioredoxin family protein n=1 Tax=Janibacter terrae TaxID=103817 RepID=A0ABZ2FFN3_9MICO